VAIVVRFVLTNMCGYKNALVVGRV